MRIYIYIERYNITYHLRILYVWKITSLRCWPISRLQVWSLPWSWCLENLNRFLRFFSRILILKYSWVRGFPSYTRDLEVFLKKRVLYWQIRWMSWQNRRERWFRPSYHGRGFSALARFVIAKTIAWWVVRGMTYDRWLRRKLMYENFRKTRWRSLLRWVKSDRLNISEPSFATDVLIEAKWHKVARVINPDSVNEESNEHRQIVK